MHSQQRSGTMRRTGRSEPGRWGWGAQFLLVVGITTVLWFFRWATSSSGEEWDELSSWLDSQGLGRYKVLFKKSGECQ